MTRMIASAFGIGFLKPAPGTWGALAALIAALVLYLIGGPWLLLMALAVVFVVGLWAVGIETKSTLSHDPSWIVVDEVVGQWIAVLPVAFGAWHAGAPVTALWPGWVVAFLLFRLFDIWKPGWVGRMDRREDPLGLMLDDVVAGLFAAVGVVVLAGVAHGLMRLL